MMKPDSQNPMGSLQKCLIFTGADVLPCLEKNMSNDRSGGLLTYHCLLKEHIRNIPAVKNYEIVVDFSNKEIHSILVAMLNQLMKSDCSFTMKVLDIPSIKAPYMESTMDLLKKLKKNNLIELEIRHKEEKIEEEFMQHPVQNAAFFIGPGNTGKTSIMSSISELFDQKGQSAALLDLTKEYKLSNYFSEYFNLSGTYSLNQLKSKRYQTAVDLYVYDYDAASGGSAVVSISKTIRYLSKHYDHVLVNTDEHVLSYGAALFQIPASIYVVHDCMLNKIAATHKILFDLNQSGINMKKTSLIYNKVAKKASDLGMIEENLVFTKNSKDHLIPLIDLHCRTLEIFYHEKTMAALNHKMVTKARAIYSTSKNYITNMDRLYRFIIDQDGYEYDMKFREFIFYHASIIVDYYILPRINKGIFIKINHVFKNIRSKEVDFLKKMSHRIASF